MRLSFILVLLLISAVTRSQNPGGIKGAVAWMQAGDTSVQQKDNKPSPAERSLLNFNPALQFTGSSLPLPLPAVDNDYSQITLFVVYEKSRYGDEQNIWRLNTSSFSSGLSTKKINDPSGILYFKSPSVNTALINTYIRKWKTDPVPGSGLPELIFGQSDEGTAPFKGRLAEFLFYNRVLKTLEQHKIETYLAIKYGITLQHDYISSEEKTLWSVRNNTGYNHRVAGIGRDDSSHLNQKQSQSGSEEISVTIGAGTIVPTNDDNKQPIRNMDFLLFGDDGGELILEESPGKEAPVQLFKRHWMMQVTGDATNSLPTELSFDVSRIPVHLPPSAEYILAINRCGCMNPSPGTAEYFSADEVATDGTIRFRNIYWDTDHSSKDIFALGIRKKDDLPESTGPAGIFRGETGLFPNPSPNGYFTISIQLEKASFVQLDIFDPGGKRVQSIYRKGQRNYIIRSRIKGDAGSYTIVISTSGGKTSRKLIVQ